MADRGVCSNGLITVVYHVAKARATLRINIPNGKFQEVIALR
jgi:hypothetical protein